MEKTTGRVKSVAQYIQLVERNVKILGLSNTTTTPYFRGQGNSNHKLIPSIFRYDGLVAFERDTTRDFKLLCRTLLSGHHFPNTEMEWIYLMQHYGMPTRLLDWSESSLVALFFAVEKMDSTTDGAVWMLSSRAFNRNIFKDTNTVPIDSSPYVANYILQPDQVGKINREVEASYPIAVRPSKNSPRILAQRGVFTIHGKVPCCIEELGQLIQQQEGYRIITKIDVDGNSKQTILKQLYQSGISHSVLFPELSGVSKELVNRYTQFFKPSDKVMTSNHKRTKSS